MEIQDLDFMGFDWVNSGQQVGQNYTEKNNTDCNNCSIKNHARNERNQIMPTSYQQGGPSTITLPATKKASTPLTIAHPPHAKSRRLPIGIDTGHIFAGLCSLLSNVQGNFAGIVITPFKAPLVKIAQWRKSMQSNFWLAVGKLKEL